MPGRGTAREAGTCEAIMQAYTRRHDDCMTDLGEKRWGVKATSQQTLDRTLDKGSMARTACELFAARKEIGSRALDTSYCTPAALTCYQAFCHILVHRHCEQGHCNTSFPATPHTLIQHPPFPAQHTLFQSSYLPWVLFPPSPVPLSQTYLITQIYQVPLHSVIYIQEVMCVRPSIC